MKAMYWDTVWGLAYFCQRAPLAPKTLHLSQPEGR